MARLWPRVSAAACDLVTLATVVIFAERFREGAWIYFLLVPVLYLAFGAFRRRLGPPPSVEDRLGRLLSSSRLSPPTSESLYAGITLGRILIPLDRSPFAEQAISVARTLGHAYESQYTLLTVLEAHRPDAEAARAGPSDSEARDYLGSVARELGPKVTIAVASGNPAQEIGAAAQDGRIDAVVMATHGRSALKRWLSSSTTSDVIYQTTPPLIVVRPTDAWQSTRTRFARLLVALDGSEVAEQVLPFVHGLAARFGSEVILFSAAEGAESDDFVPSVQEYLGRFAADLERKGIRARILVERGAAARAIVRTTTAEDADLIMMVSHGRGGVERQEYVRLGSVATHVVEECPCPVFLISAREPKARAA